MKVTRTSASTAVTAMTRNLIGSGKHAAARSPDSGPGRAASA
ncbi:hypothetical protein ACFQXA_28690 [Nocardiopsis composta]